MKAWLIRWCWAGDHAAVDDPVVAVLSARTSAADVRWYVEQRYIEVTASPVLEDGAGGRSAWSCYCPEIE